MAQRPAAIAPGQPPDPLADAGREIREAQDKLLAVERRLSFQTDDSAPLFSAMAAFLGGLHRTVAAVRGLIETAQPPILASEIKAMNEAAATHAANALPHAIKQLGTQISRRTSLLAAGIWLASLLIVGASGYWWGISTEAERYANIPAEFNVQMSNRDAGRWLELMRKNTAKGTLDGCKAPVEQPNGGKACAFTLWTELPPPAAQ